MVEPPGRVSSAGQEAVELAASAGLFLDPWQAWCLDGILAERADGNWCAFEAALIVGRQNGKGSVLEALELAGLFLLDERLIVHSAHKFDTAQEHFLRMQALIESSDDLAGKVAKISTANGKEAIHLRNGARLKFVARSRGSARGFSGDRIVFDEAMILPPEALGSMIPTLATRPRAQIVYAGSAPMHDSQVLHALRKRSRSADPGRLWFAEWGNETAGPGLDWDAVAAANPGLGYRILPEFVQDEQAALPPSEFLRERLGVAEAEDSGSNMFGPGRWQACGDPDSAVNMPAAFTVDIDPDQQWASCAVAARSGQDVLVELVERRPGTGWVVEYARAFCARWSVPVVYDPRSPTAGLVPDLVTAGVPVQELPGGEFSAACAALQRAVIEGTVRHRAQRQLDDAVYAAAVRQTGDSWVWARARSDLDISPLVAVTLAHWSVIQAPEPAPASFAY